MRTLPHPLHIRLLPCIAVVAVMTAIQAPDAVAVNALFDTVSIEIVAPPSSDPVVTDLMVLDLGAAKLLTGLEWTGLMTVPPAENAPRLILLRSADGSKYALGIILASQDSAADWSGYCIYIDVGPSPSFSFGSMSATFTAASI